jgi:hypothetical protein
MTRAREGLVRTRVGLANQLRDQLACFWPGAGKVFSAVDSQIALAFLRRYPTPLDARGLGEQRLAAFLKRHGYPGRKPASELLERLRGGAEGRAGELEMQARREVVLALVSALEPIVARISELTIEIRHALDEHPDGATFRSLFIAHNSWLCAATMLAEIGDCRDRYPTSTSAPVPEARATLTPPASSAVPGARSSGACGTTVTPTTPTNTPPASASSPRPPDNSVGPGGPTFPATQRRPAPPSPAGCPQGTARSTRRQAGRRYLRRSGLTQEVYERKRIAPTVIALKLVALETAGPRSLRQPTLLV